ncbi:MAG: T9SS outer membrane translocon Sov/SprA, partial [Bacteroidia bacterium]
SSLKIELTGNRTSSSNLSEYTRWDTSITANHLFPSYQFNESRSLTGNYSISVFTLGRSFKDKSTGVESQLFQEFLSTRQDYARKLSQANSKNSAGLLQNGVGQPYYDGYSPTQQDVLMGAFYETYTGRKIKNFSTSNIFPTVPMPNWTLSWDGLGKIKQFKKLFRSITLRSGYRSTYTLGGYSNNLLYGADANGNQVARSPVDVGSLGQNANFNSYYSVSSVVLNESFAPLIKVDLQFTKPGWQGNFEVKKDKTVTLNLTGPQIIETKGQEYVIGLGYRYPKLTIKKLQIQGKPLQSDLNVKVDLSYRRNVSVIRGIVNDISTPTGGTDIITLRSSIDYQLTPNINLRLFYDWIRTKPQTSASFPTSNTNAGFSLRINLQ